MANMKASRRRRSVRIARSSNGARWIGLEPPVHSNSFRLSAASLSGVEYDRDLSNSVINLWNDTHHVSIT